MAIPPNAHRCNYDLTTHSTALHKNPAYCDTLFTVIDAVKDLSKDSYISIETFAASRIDLFTSVLSLDLGTLLPEGDNLDVDVDDNVEILKFNSDDTITDYVDLVEDERSNFEIVNDEKLKVPAQLRLLFLWRMRLIRLRLRNASKWYYYEAFYSAITILLCCYQDTYHLTSYFHDKFEILKDFTYLLRSSPGTDSFNANIPLKLRLLASNSLQALFASEENIETGIFGRLLHLQHSLGLNRGQYMGLIPNLLRSSALYLVSISELNVNAEPNTLQHEEQLLWIESIFLLTISALEFAETGQFLPENGLLTSLIEILKIPPFKNKSKLLTFIDSVIIITADTCLSIGQVCSSFIRQDGVDYVLNRLHYEIDNLNLVNCASSLGDVTDALAVSTKLSSNVNREGGSFSFYECFDKKVAFARPAIYNIFSLLHIVLERGLQDSNEHKVSQLFKSPIFVTCLQVIYSNVGIFSTRLVDMVDSLLSNMINSDPATPAMLNHLINNHVIELVLKSFIEDNVNYPNDDDFQSFIQSKYKIVFTEGFLTDRVNLFFFISLTSEGIDLIKSLDPFPTLFDIFCDKYYYFPSNKLMTLSLAKSLGGCLEEILRHYPTLLSLILDSIINSINSLINKSVDIVLSTLEMNEEYLGILHSLTCLLYCLHPLLNKDQTLSYFISCNGIGLLCQLFRVVLGPKRYFLANLGCAVNSTAHFVGYTQLVSVLELCCSIISSKKSSDFIKTIADILDRELDVLARNVHNYWIHYGSISTKQSSSSTVKTTSVVEDGLDNNIGENENLMLPISWRVNGIKLSDIVLTVNQLLLSDYEVVNSGDGVLPKKLQDFAVIAKSLVTISYLLNTLFPPAVRIASYQPAPNSTLESQLKNEKLFEIVSFLIKDVFVSSQFEISRHTQSTMYSHIKYLENEAAKIKKKIHPIYKILITSDKGVWVRCEKDKLPNVNNYYPINDDINIYSNTNNTRKLHLLPKGTIINAYERKQLGNRSLLYRIDDGWISSLKRTSSSEPHFEVIDVLPKPQDQIKIEDEIVSKGRVFSKTSCYDTESRTLGDISASRAGYLSLFHISYSIRIMMESISKTVVQSLPGTLSPQRYSTTTLPKPQLVRNLFILISCFESISSKLCEINPLMNQFSKSLSVLDSGNYEASSTELAKQKFGDIMENKIEIERFKNGNIFSHEQFTAYPLPLSLENCSISFVYLTLTTIEMLTDMLFISKTTAATPSYEVNILLLLHLFYSNNRILENLLQASVLVFISGYDVGKLSELAGCKVSPEDNSVESLECGLTLEHYLSVLNDRQKFSIESSNGLIDFWNKIIGYLTHQLTPVDKNLMKMVMPDRFFDPYVLKRHLSKVLSKYMVGNIIACPEKLRTMPFSIVKQVLDVILNLLKAIQEVKSAPVSSHKSSALTKLNSSTSSNNANMNSSTISHANVSRSASAPEPVRIAPSFHHSTMTPHPPPGLSTYVPKLQTLQALEEMGFPRNSIFRAMHNLQTNNIDRLAVYLSDSFDDDSTLSATLLQSLNVLMGNAQSSSTGQGQASATSESSAETVAAVINDNAEPYESSNNNILAESMWAVPSLLHQEMMGVEAHMADNARPSSSSTTTRFGESLLMNLMNRGMYAFSQSRPNRDRPVLQAGQPFGFNFVSPIAPKKTNNLDETAESCINIIPMIKQNAKEDNEIEKKTLFWILDYLFDVVPLTCMHMIENGFDNDKSLELVSQEVLEDNKFYTRDVSNVILISYLLNCLERRSLSKLGLKINLTAWFYCKCLTLINDIDKLIESQPSEVFYSKLDSIFGLLHSINILFYSSSTVQNMLPHSQMKLQHAHIVLLLLLFTRDVRFNILYEKLIILLEKYVCHLQTEIDKGSYPDVCHWISPCLLLLDTVSQSIVVDKSTLSVMVRDVGLNNELDLAGELSNFFEVNAMFSEKFIDFLRTEIGSTIITERFDSGGDMLDDDEDMELVDPEVFSRETHRDWRPTNSDDDEEEDNDIVEEYLNNHEDNLGFSSEDPADTVEENKENDYDENIVDSVEEHKEGESASARHVFEIRESVLNETLSAGGENSLNANLAEPTNTATKESESLNIQQKSLSDSSKAEYSSSNAYTETNASVKTSEIPELFKYPFVETSLSLDQRMRLVDVSLKLLDYQFKRQKHLTAISAERSTETLNYSTGYAHIQNSVSKRTTGKDLTTTHTILQLLLHLSQSSEIRYQLQSLKSSSILLSLSYPFPGVDAMMCTLLQRQFEADDVLAQTIANDIKHCYFKLATKKAGVSSSIGDSSSDTEGKVLLLTLVDAALTIIQRDQHIFVDVMKKCFSFTIENEFMYVQWSKPYIQPPPVVQLDLDSSDVADTSCQLKQSDFVVEMSDQAFGKGFPDLCTNDSTSTNNSTVQNIGKSENKRKSVSVASNVFEPDDTTEGTNKKRRISEEAIHNLININKSTLNPFASNYAQITVNSIICKIAALVKFYNKLSQIYESDKMPLKSDKTKTDDKVVFEINESSSLHVLHSDNRLEDNSIESILSPIEDVDAKTCQYLGLSISDLLSILADLIATVPGVATCVHKYVFQLSSSTLVSIGNVDANDKAKIDPYIHALYEIPLNVQYQQHFLSFLIHVLLLRDYDSSTHYFADELLPSPTSAILKESLLKRKFLHQISGTCLRDNAAFLLATLVSRPGEGRRRTIIELIDVMKYPNSKSNVSAVNNEALIKSTRGMNAVLALTETIGCLLSPPSRWNSRDLIVIPSFDVLFHMCKLDIISLLSNLLNSISLGHPYAIQATSKVTTLLDVFIRKGMDFVKKVQQQQLSTGNKLKSMSRLSSKLSSSTESKEAVEGTDFGEIDMENTPTVCASANDVSESTRPFTVGISDSLSVDLDHVGVSLGNFRSYDGNSSVRMEDDLNVAALASAASIQFQGLRHSSSQFSDRSNQNNGDDRSLSPSTRLLSNSHIPDTPHTISSIGHQESDWSPVDVIMNRDEHSNSEDDSDDDSDDDDGHNEDTNNHNDDSNVSNNDSDDDESDDDSETDTYQNRMFRSVSTHAHGTAEDSEDGDDEEDSDEDEDEVDDEDEELMEEDDVEVEENDHSQDSHVEVFDFSDAITFGFNYL